MGWYVNVIQTHKNERERREHCTKFNEFYEGKSWILDCFWKQSQAQSQMKSQPD